MKKWGRRRSSAKEENVPAENHNGGSNSSSPPPLPPSSSSKKNRTNATSSSGDATSSRRKEKASPDLSNLWSRKQSVEGGDTSKNERSAFYPVVGEIHVPPTKDILTKKLPYALHDKEDKVKKPGVVSVKSAPRQAKPGASSSPTETKPGAVAVAGSGSVSQQAKKEENENGDERPSKEITSEAVSLKKKLPEREKTGGALPFWGSKAKKSGTLTDDDVDDDENEQQSRSMATASSFDSAELGKFDAGSSFKKKPPVSLDTAAPLGAGNKRSNSVKPWGSVDSKPSVAMAATSGPVFGVAKRPSLLDDDGDDDSDEGRGTSVATLPVSMDTSSAVQPQIWGRKVKKATLEEDTPDGRELAFAEGSISLSSSTATFGLKKPPPESVFRRYVSEGDGSDEGEPRKVASNDSYDENISVSATQPPDMMQSQHKDVTEEDLLQAALLESKNIYDSQASSVFMTAEDIEDAKENARSLRSMIASDNVDVGFLQTVLSMCRNDQKKVARCIENGTNEAEIGVLLDLNSNILDAIKLGEKVAQSKIKSGGSVIEDNRKPAAKKKNNMDVEELVQKQDTFSLICMLRVQQNDKRLDAALALMRFARAAQEVADKENVQLRDEISSSGGLHSLLNLYRIRGTAYELRVITALAVAYVLPSFVEPSSQTSPRLGLKIVECLRFLSTAHSVSHNGETLTADEMFNASAMALTNFWVNHLEPILISRKEKVAESDDLIRSTSLGRQRSRSSGGAILDQRQESIALDELLEMTVALVIYVAEQESRDTSRDTCLQKDGEIGFRWSHTLVEQVCAVEIARPIAVRAGILQILVGWIRSKEREKIRTAASALRYLTSVKDKYMAGWIHSEMVNKGAVQGLADLTHDITVTHDVRLAIAQILSSLCAAPHTRAAVVEANSINFLIGILYDHNDPSAEEVALFAGSAILQLTAGAIMRASAFCGGDLDGTSYVAPDKRDSLIDDIVEGGAISSFVSIAQNNRGKLRSIAVQALRVISEDISRCRQTRLQLCEDAAARALGTTLKDDVDKLGNVLRGETDDLTDVEKEDSLKELNEALCALANIFDPAQEGYAPKSDRAVSSSSFKDPQRLLIKGCLETANSGGLESLLAIALLPFPSRSDSSSQNMELLEQACRSLASMAPLLLTAKVAATGYSKWAHDVLLALHRVLRELSGLDKSEAIDIRTIDLHVIVLQGLGALARSAPLKVRIIDRTLPYLIQARSIRDQPDVSNAAWQAFQSLDLADDEVAAQVAGNAPSVYAEWFCLQRSLLIQAMARAEIRNLLYETWNTPFQQTDHGLTKLIRNCSGISRSTGDETAVEGSDLFGNFANDDHTTQVRETLLSEYKDIYAGRHDESDFSEGSSEDNGEGLLSQQAYPLNNSFCETKWILDHRRSLADYELSRDKGTLSNLSEHVQKLLRFCFPSSLLRDQLVPVDVLCPASSFNFRALMMAQKRYFSFRREGQLLVRLCDKEAASVDSTDVHWTLGFTNSAFAGEFAENLVQILYKCPMIHGLSFARYSDWKAPEDGDKENGNEDGHALLANLAGSLPPWISHLTFAGVFDDLDLKTLVSVLDTMGKLSAGQDGTTEQDRDLSQGKFRFFAIRRSPNLSAEAWLSFFSLLGGKLVVSKHVVANPLTTLKALDLSGNELGDNLCASVLEIVHSRSSGCNLEELDLSSNCIHSATNVLRVLRTYCNDRISGVGSHGRGWRAPLRKLRLAANGLHIGKVWLELIILVQNNGLELTSLDLSSNGLILGENESQFATILVRTLTSNSFLHLLDLSNNMFGSTILDFIIRELSEKAKGHAVVRFDSNSPPLSLKQSAALREVSVRARKRALQLYLHEQERLDNLDYSQPINKPEQLNLSVETFPNNQGFDEFPTASSVPGTSDQGRNLITVLFSAPLVFSDGTTLRPFAKLDFDMERELMWQCLKEASRDIDLSFDSATHDRLLATMAKRCSCLHYSGHGHKQYLPFEDGSGGPYWFKVDQFKSLIERVGGAPFRFVFVSACHSELAGHTFASAGVPHVVCCQQTSELKDTAALAFTRQFYLALAIGHTVKDSFEQGCKAVRATPNLKDPDSEMEKFILLPKDGNHDVPIFKAKPVSEWPKPLLHDERSHRSRRRSRSTASMIGGARSSELSVRNMMQEDPSPSPPEFFLGREVDMYYVLKAVLNKRLVSVIGEVGVGRSSLVCALCHYINERASTIIGIDRIYFVRARQSRRKKNPFRTLVQSLLKKLIEEDRAHSVDSSSEADMETMFDIICKSLKHEKALIVFDRAELVVNADADEANEFPMLLSKLCRETYNVKVLLTNRHGLGIPSLGEHPISLGPLNFADTVLLFSNLCPYLHTPADRRKLIESLVTDGAKAELLPTDPVDEATKKVFATLGDGIPSRIEKAAYDLTKEDFLKLMNKSK